MRKRCKRPIASCRDYFNKVRTEGHKLLVTGSFPTPDTCLQFKGYEWLSCVKGPHKNRFENSFIPRSLCIAKWFYSILLLFYCAIKVWVRFGKCLCVSVVGECKFNLTIAKIKSYLILRLTTGSWTQCGTELVANARSWAQVLCGWIWMNELLSVLQSSGFLQSVELGRWYSIK